MEVVLEDRRSKMDSARDELEKAYAPLYTLLNRYRWGVIQEKVVLDEGEKKQLDQIMAAYPFMFPAEIYELWQQKINKMKATRLDLRYTQSYFEIPQEFVEKITKEYDLRVKRYNEIFGNR
jgi:hypothetical protein